MKEKYPLRSVLEVSFFVGSILLAYQCTGDATFAVILGLAVGIITTVSGELMFTELLMGLSTRVQATSEHAEALSPAQKLKQNTTKEPDGWLRRVLVDPPKHQYAS